jgi:hypothetical protein
MPVARKKKPVTKYAAGTTVSISRSCDAIRKMLHDHGATNFTYGEQEYGASILFKIHDRFYRMSIVYPALSTFRSSQRTLIQQKAAYEAEQRRRWRSLVLVVKAKLEAAASEITTIEQEFLGYAVLPNSSTVSEWFEVRAEEIYTSGRMPLLLTEFTEAKDTDIPDFTIEQVE